MPRTIQQTLQTSQNLQTNLLGGGFTLPLPPPRPLGSECCSQSWRTRGPLGQAKSLGKMCISCLWTRLGPIKVVMLTTLGQTTRHVDDILAKNRLFDDLMMKNYDFDALCYPVVCVNSLEYVGKTSVF